MMVLGRFLASGREPGWPSNSGGFLLREGRLYRPRLLEGVRKVRVEEWRESGNDFYEFVCLSRRRCVGIRINGLLGGISS